MERRPFDAANKLLFSHRRMAADLIRLLDDDRIVQLDLGALERLPSEHVLDNLRIRREDLPFLARYEEDAGPLPGAGIVFQFEFQSQLDPDMLERMAEYWALQRRHLRRSRKVLGPSGELPPVVPVVVHTGPAHWSPPCRSDALDEDSQPRHRVGYFEHWLVDAKDYVGDHAADGNLARAVFALDAAPAEAAVEAALSRVAELLREAADPSLWRSFEQWCQGVLGMQLPRLTNLKEGPLMLAQTLREWEQRNIRLGREEGHKEGRVAGREEGRKAGREEGIAIGLRRGDEEVRRLLCIQASQRFGDASADAIRPLLASLRDGAQLTAVGALIVSSKTAAELLDGTLRLAEAQKQRA